MIQLPLFPDIPPPPEEKTVIPKIQTDSDFWKHHYSPKTFGSYIGQDEDTVCAKIERGKIKAINLNPGGQKARYAIPKAELDKFKPEEYRGVYKHLRD